MIRGPLVQHLADEKEPRIRSVLHFYNCVNSAVDANDCRVIRLNDACDRRTANIQIHGAHVLYSCHVFTGCLLVLLLKLCHCQNSNTRYATVKFELPYRTTGALLDHDDEVNRSEEKDNLFMAGDVYRS